MNKLLEHFEEMYLNKDDLKVDGISLMLEHQFIRTIGMSFNALTPIYENYWIIKKKKKNLIALTPINPREQLLNVNIFCQT